MTEQTLFNLHLINRREDIAELLQEPLKLLSAECALKINEPDQLEALLQHQLESTMCCKQLRILDSNAHQITAAISRKRSNSLLKGRDLAARAYIQDALKGKTYYLSDTYISRDKNRPTISAIHSIVSKTGQTVGYLCADIDLRDLPKESNDHIDPNKWQQIKGDPAIRGGLFAQQRVTSALDDKMDEVLKIVENLMIFQGVFHAKFHFSSSRITLWLVDTPYNYQILNLDDLLNPNLSLAFPARRYFKQAIVTPDTISKVFQQFKKLRFADETIYLRASSLNTVNGMVGLNFSCDGSHYMAYDNFLQKDNSFWFGVNQ